MKTTKQPTKRKINSAIGVRKEVAKRFSTFCTSRGFVISHAAEQALAAWIARESRGAAAGGGK